ncbi:MAG: glucose-6-phosphate dehydrogenase [Burkholderiales bacterium]
MEEQSFDLILFGGTGDLAMRKLMPGLYYRHRGGRDMANARIIAAARQNLTREQYLERVLESCKKFIPAEDFGEGAWRAFAAHIFYVKVDGTDAAGYQALKDVLKDASERVRVFYLATVPDLFVTICTHLASANLVTPKTRVVLEKPLGRDLASAQKINEQVGAIFAEDQIFRIDHYLGKETVQNLIALRFGNTLFEPLWNRGSIRDVQITIAEQVGVEGRGEFYDRTGALRDMVQNHLLQLLCILAMEPPSSIDADAVRDEKLKVLRALKPMTPQDVAERTVRAQYRAGAIEGKPVPSFHDEAGIPKDSLTETFVAIKAELATWRWAGVPFYLRTGKRMQERMAEIVVNFHAVPHAILPSAVRGSHSNRLVIQLQPEQGLKLYLMAKVPGEDMRVRPVHLNLDFEESFEMRQWDAYERLIMDVIRGKLTLFMRRDELDAAWRWIEPIMHGWATQGDRPKTYTAGTWGPAASSALLVRDGFSWHEET